MNHFIIVFYLTTLLSNFGFSQQKNTFNYKVQKGENVSIIARNNNISIKEIYKLNPNSENGIQENSILILPSKKYISNIKNTVNHIVVAKETLFSLSKLYKVSIADIELENKESLKEGLKIGTVLKIPSVKNIVSKVVLPTKKTILHTIQPKETKYAIAKKYDITIETLEKNNPEIGSNFPIGYELLIAGSRPQITTKKVEEIKKPISETKIVYENSQNIQKRDTLPNIFNKEITNLTKNYKIKNSKNVALLLPFNLDKINQDSVNSVKSRLKKDKFLNMTLDFYAGALIAIDSVKKMGLNMNVTILDSNESKYSSSVENLVQNNNLAQMDAIIGPFYQNNIENLAKLVNSNSTTIFSPLSKDYDKKFSNLVQTIPSNADLKSAMFAFMNSKNANIVAVVDSKKISTKQYIMDNHKNVNFALFLENGSLDIPILKSQLVSNKTNFVILETENTNLILNTIDALGKLVGNYEIKLALLGENEALDFEEIQINKLTRLRMHYPSITRVNDSNEATIFQKKFKKLNQILPNTFATRGFDLTFDVLLRLSQENSLVETFKDNVSEQIENKFYYQEIPEDGFVNKGVYILYYDTDMTIKTAKL